MRHACVSFCVRFTHWHSAATTIGDVTKGVFVLFGHYGRFDTVVVIVVFHACHIAAEPTFGYNLGWA